MNYIGRMARRIELFADVCLTALTFVGIYAVKRRLLPDPVGGLTTAPNFYLSLLMIIAIWYLTLDMIVIRGYGSKTTGAMITEVFKGVTTSSLVLLLGMYIFKISDISCLFVFMFFIADLILLVVARLTIRKVLFLKRRGEHTRRNILILGSRATAQEVIRIVSSENESNIKIVGCIELNRGDVGKDVCGIAQVIGTIDDIQEILLNRIIDEILIAMPLNEIRNSEWLLSFLNTFGITIRIVPNWYIRKFMSHYPTRGFSVDRLLSEPVLVISNVQANSDSLVVKSIMSFFLAFFALVVTFPLFVIIACLIKLASPGPIFDKQISCGQYGRKFRLLKFRSMVVGAETMHPPLIEQNEDRGRTRKIKENPRIIPYIGKFIRKFGLDELPRFINVLRGEMSIVGPSPAIPSDVQKYEFWQRRRLMMKPGMTCLWRIQPRRGDVSFDHWIALDLHYIEHWTLWLDVVIILKTVLANPSRNDGSNKDRQETILGSKEA